MPDKEQISSYALTTVQRVKDILQTPDDGFEPIITRYINGATDFIERLCGKTGMERSPNDGHFVMKTYTREVYSVRGQHQKMLLLRNAPVLYCILEGVLVGGNPTMTSIPDTTGIVAGMPVIGPGFPSATTVVSKTATTVTFSANASSSDSEAIVEVSGLIGFQWRAGTPSNPGWMDFIADQFELVEQGASGIVRVYGAMPQLYSNMIRATYVAGYPIDWENAGNGTSHRLPADLTRVCENLVVRFFKRRQNPGKNGETIQGGTINWKDGMDALDLQTLQAYMRVGSIF